MKWVLWVVATAALVCVFCACGDGAVDARGGEDDMALLNYGPPFVDGDTGNMWTLRSQAIKDCEAEESCKNAMDRADGDIEDFRESSFSIDSVLEESSSSAKPRSSTASVVRLSSVAQVISEVTASSSGAAENLSAASSSVTAVQSNTSTVPVIRSCSPNRTSIVKGNSVEWVYETNGTPAATYQWTFPGAAVEISDEANPTVVYPRTGTFSARVLTDGATKDLNCVQKVTVVGPEVTGCYCEPPVLKSANNDMRSNSPVRYEWTVKGCSSVDGLGKEETNFSYAWSGQGITGNTEVGSGSFTEMGLYSAAVTATNSDGKSMTVTCSEKAPVDDATWTFRCSPMNSTVLDVPGGDNNNVQINAKANTCYSYQMDKCTRQPQYTNQIFNLQVASWNGASTMHYLDCDGNEGSAGTGNGSFAAMNMNYYSGKACTIYFYTEGNVDNLQIHMWP